MDGTNPGVSGRHHGCLLAIDFFFQLIPEFRDDLIAARSAPSCLNPVRFVKELSASHTIPKMDHLHFGDICVATHCS